MTTSLHGIFEDGVKAWLPITTHTVVTFQGEASLPRCIRLSSGNCSLLCQGKSLDSMYVVL